MSASHGRNDLGPCHANASATLSTAPKKKASFSLSDAERLPRGRVRIARVHVRTTGAAEPDYDLRLVAAGAADGQPIAAELSFEIQTER